MNRLTQKKTVCALIPARLNSVRFPGKALKRIDGVPMVVRVLTAARKSGVFDAVYAATDSPEIASVCREYGFEVIFTSNFHQNPTSRVQEAVTILEDSEPEHPHKFDFYAMIGGDEPLLTPEILRDFMGRALETMDDGLPAHAIISKKYVQRPFLVNAMADIPDEAETADPSNIKVVCRPDGTGLYISRAPIPFRKGTLPEPSRKFVSIGLYTRESLDFFCQSQPGILEQIEGVDLLRFLEYGKTILFLPICGYTLSVDTPADLNQVQAILHRRIYHHMNHKTYRGVIFDLDGTLLDTSEGVFASVRHTVEALGKPALDDATLRTFIGPPVKLSLIRLYGLDEDAANHATEIFRNQYKDHDLLKAEPYAGIKELIRALRAQGYKIGVATLKREDYALTLLEHYHFTELCDSICGSDFASKMTKTDVLHKCLHALELSPSEAVLIGDTASDGKGAKEAGVDFMAVTYGFGPDTEEAWQEYEPVYTAKDTHEIGTFLGVDF